MKYIAYVLISLTIGCTTNVYGQIQSVALCEVENVIFKAEVINYKNFIFMDSSLIYHIGDTVDIKYSVKNNSAEIVYIFDPEGETLYENKETQKDSSCCCYIYSLGGDFYYEHRAENNYLKLIELNPSESFEYTFKYVLSEDKYRDNCEFGIPKSWSFKSPKTNLILFHIGYIFKSYPVKLTEKDKEGYREFIDIMSGFQFHFLLRRFYLGPLMVEFRK